MLAGKVGARRNPINHTPRAEVLPGIADATEAVIDLRCLGERESSDVRSLARVLRYAGCKVTYSEDGGTMTVESKDDRPIWDRINQYGFGGSPQQLQRYVTTWYVDSDEGRDLPPEERKIENAIGVEIPGIESIMPELKSVRDKFQKLGLWETAKDNRTRFVAPEGRTLDDIANPYELANLDEIPGRILYF